MHLAPFVISKFIWISPALVSLKSAQFSFLNRCFEFNLNMNLFTVFIVLKVVPDQVLSFTIFSFVTEVYDG